MKKIIIFSVPSDTADSTLVPKLDELMSELGVHSHVIVLTEKDLACNTRQIHPAIVILKDIIKTCGTGKNRINFNVNFYQALANGFYASTKDVKIILNEIIEGRNIPEVVEFAKANDILFIFKLAEEALGMMR